MTFLNDKDFDLKRSKKLIVLVDYPMSSTLSSLYVYMAINNVMNSL